MGEISLLQGFQLEGFGKFGQSHGQKIERVQDPDLHVADGKHLNFTPPINDEGRTEGLRKQVLQEKLAVVGQVVEKDRVSLVVLVKQPLSEFRQCPKDALSTTARVPAGWRDVLFGLLVDLGAGLAAVPAFHTLAVGSQIFFLAFPTGSLTHREDEGMSRTSALRLVTVLTESTDVASPVAASRTVLSRSRSVSKVALYQFVLLGGLDVGKDVSPSTFGRGLVSPGVAQVFGVYVALTRPAGVIPADVVFWLAVCVPNRLETGETSVHHVTRNDPLLQR
jgi:hypothetical protein